MTYDWTLTPTTLLNSRVGYRPPLEPGLRVAGGARIRSGGGPRARSAPIDGMGFPGHRRTCSPPPAAACPKACRTPAACPATKKPQALVNITHSRNTHTYKAGFEWRNDIFRMTAINGSFGAVHVQRPQSGLPSTQGQNLGGGNVGLPYASFLMGLVNTASCLESDRIRTGRSRPSRCSCRTPGG